MFFRNSIIVKLVPANFETFRQQFVNPNSKRHTLTQIVSWGSKDIGHENKDDPGSHRIRERHLFITNVTGALIGTN